MKFLPSVLMLCCTSSVCSAVPPRLHRHPLCPTGPSDKSRDFSARPQRTPDKPDSSGSSSAQPTGTPGTKPSGQAKVTNIPKAEFDIEAIENRIVKRMHLKIIKLETQNTLLQQKLDSCCDRAAAEGASRKDQMIRNLRARIVELEHDNTKLKFGFAEGFAQYMTLYNQRRQGGPPDGSKPGTAPSTGHPAARQTCQSSDDSVCGHAQEPRDKPPSCSARGNDGRDAGCPGPTAHPRPEALPVTVPHTRRDRRNYVSQFVPRRGRDPRLHRRRRRLGDSEFSPAFVALCQEILDAQNQ